MIPKGLKLQNFLSHDVSEIDFNRFESALILGTYGDEIDQSNGAGKSAIFEAVSWALFGKSRHKKVDGVVKWDKRACRVEFSFSVDGETYCVTRTRDKILRDSDVILGQWDGSEFKSISCDTNTATDNKIVDIINFNYDVFVNSVYFKQNDISMFATTTPSKRKDVLKSLLKMDKWDTYQKKAKDYVKSLGTKIDEKSQTLIPVQKLEEELVLYKEEIIELKKQLRSSNKDYQDFGDKLLGYKTKYETTFGDSNDPAAMEKLKRLQLEFSKAKKRMQEINVKKEDNNRIINNNNSQVSQLYQDVRLLKDKIKLGKNIEIDKLRSKMMEGKTREKILLGEITELKKDIKLAGNCDLCKRPLTKKEIEDIRVDYSNELNETQRKYDDLKIKLSNAVKILQDKENLIVAANKAELDKGKMEIRVSKFKSEIDSCILQNERLVEEYDKLKSTNFQQEIDNLKLKFDKDSAEQLHNKITESEKEISELKKKIDKLNVEYGSKIRKLNEITDIQKKQEEIQNEINKLTSEYTVYDKLKDYFGKDGIQSVIIENVIEELENYANDTLNKLCNEPTSISIKTQKQNDNGSWTETFDIFVKAGSRTDDFDTFSGGEQFRISLALRLALSNILSNRMGGVIKFLLLDEVSSNLDNKGLEMFINIVKQLSEDMKVLVITHNERLKERFDDVILVNKGTTGSTISFQ